MLFPVKRNTHPSEVLCAVAPIVRVSAFDVVHLARLSDIMRHFAPLTETLIPGLDKLTDMLYVGAKAVAVSPMRPITSTICESGQSSALGIAVMFPPGHLSTLSLIERFRVHSCVKLDRESSRRSPRRRFPRTAVAVRYAWPQAPRSVSIPRTHLSGALGATFSIHHPSRCGVEQASLFGNPSFHPLSLQFPGQVWYTCPTSPFHTLPALSSRFYLFSWSRCACIRYRQKKFRVVGWLYSRRR